MSDPAFVAAAYSVVIGGLVLYVLSIVNRARAAGRIAAAVLREREGDGSEADSAAPR
jgi:hypothetical protein